MLYLLLAATALLVHRLVVFSAPERCLLNSGVSFGLFSHSAVLLGIAAFLLGVGLVLIAQKSEQFRFSFAGRERSLRFYSGGLLVAAGLNNLLDRLVLGGVCDYWELVRVVSLNINDIIICIVLALFFKILLLDGKDRTGA